MHTLTLNIKNSTYESISYFLTNLSNDVEIVNHNINQDIDNQVNQKSNLRGVFSQYSSSEKISQESAAWENHIIEQYKKDN